MPGDTGIVGFNVFDYSNFSLQLKGGLIRNHRFKQDPREYPIMFSGDTLADNARHGLLELERRGGLGLQDRED
jgi:hypothetical protein